jgi:membrane protein DedA with SNARE-associated domain/rhodanese-related sulfurtransferase
MHSLFFEISKHGLALLFGLVFLESVGIPLPAALALLIAGAGCARGLLNPEAALLGSVAVIMCGDYLLYLMGRRTGWWLMRILCRLSLNPESCILRTADKFYKHGRSLLLFAKFIPGVNALAPPLAGSMQMPFSRFVPFELAGAAIYVGAYWGIGYTFSNVFEKIVGFFDSFSRLVGWLTVAALVVYFLYQLRWWLKARGLHVIPRIDPQEVARIFYAPGGDQEMAIFDVRSHGYYDRDALRIRGSLRLEPNSLYRIRKMPDLKHVVLYCTCVRQATSLPVARVLREQGLQCSVLEGGLTAWRKAGLPMEEVPFEEILELPSFAA